MSGESAQTHDIQMWRGSRLPAEWRGFWRDFNQNEKQMKKLLLCLLGLALVASAAFAGVGYSGKEMKQVAPPPCPEWYADREFNISLWGTYVFTGTNWINDRYIEADHAWGGGIDLKYFFMRYIGVGIEGWVVDARQARQNTFIDFSDGVFLNNIQRQSNADRLCLGHAHAALSDSLHAALRHTFLVEVAGSLAEARSKSTSALSSREKVSISSRQPVIQVARRGQSAKLAVAWKSA